MEIYDENIANKIWRDARQYVLNHCFCNGSRVPGLLRSPAYARSGARNRCRGLRLRDDWPHNQFDECDLGLGVDMGVNGVIRYLHWNGKSFVPDHPGETRLIKEALNNNGRRLETVSARLSLDENRLT